MCTSMRVLSRSRLRQFWKSKPSHAKAEKPLRQWYQLASNSHWKSPAEVKRQFGKNVDFVQVNSGNTVAVFNIHGNDYRLIAAVHYDYPRVFVLRILTHPEYDKNRWKEEL
jgi:mRNA interferase HigB